MIKINAKLDPMSMAWFENTIIRMQKETGKEISKVLRNTSRDIARASYRITPMAPANAKRWLAIYHGGSFAFWKFIGRGQFAILGTKEAEKRDSDKRYTPLTKYGKRVKKIGFSRGLAKAGWLAVMAKLGMSFRSPERLNMSLGTAQINKFGNQETYIIRNLVPFIEKLNNGNYPNGVPHNIQRRAIRMVAANMEKYLERMGKKVAGMAK